jgi:hypothetical protein
LLPKVLSQATPTNSSIPSSSPLVLPSPVHSDVPPPALSTNCTANSLSSPDLRLTSFFYQTGDLDDSWVSFTVVNRMAGSTTSCSGAGEQSRITGDCTTTGSRTGSLTESQFQYDSMTGMLTINQSWVCDDNPTAIKP